MDNSVIKKSLEIVLDNIENEDNGCYRFYDFMVSITKDKMEYDIKKGSITIRKRRAIFSYVGCINAEVARLAGCYELYNNIMVKLSSVELRYMKNSTKEKALKEISRIKRRLNG